MYDKCECKHLEIFGRTTQETGVIGLFIPRPAVFEFWSVHT